MRVAALGSALVAGTVLVGLASGAAATVRATAAPAPVGATTASVAHARSLELRTPGAVAAGDVLIAAWTIRAGGGARIWRPRGWMPVRRDSCVAGRGVTLTQALFLRVATASEPPVATWGVRRATAAVGGLVAYRGVDTGRPVEDVSGAARRHAAQILAPSVRVRVPRTLVVEFFGHTGTRRDAVPKGSKVRFDVATRRTGPTASAKAGDFVRAAAGQSGRRLARVAGGSACSIGQLLALRPSPASPPGPGSYGHGGVVRTRSCPCF